MEELDKMIDAANKAAGKKMDRVILTTPEMVYGWFVQQSFFRKVAFVLGLTKTLYVAGSPIRINTVKSEDGGKTYLEVKK